MSYLTANVSGELQISSGNNADWDRFIGSQLKAYEDQFLPKGDSSNDENFNLYLKDSDNFPKGGLLGYFYRGALFITTLWVTESERGKGYGTQLMQEAERLASERSCNHLILNTHDFNAPEFYIKLGFEVAGFIPDYPEGYSHYYMYKKLRA